VERPLDAGPIVVAEGADVVDHVLDVGLADLAIEERHLAVDEARLGSPAEVHDDLDQLRRIGQVADRREDVGRKSVEEQTQVVDRFASAVRRPLVSHVSS